MLPSANAKMQRIRVTVGALMAGAWACTSNADQPAGSAPATSTNHDTGVTGAGGSSPSRRDASDADRGADTSDVAPPEGGVFVVHNDAGPVRTACAGDLATLGSSRLSAGLSTPPGFATAFNQESALLDSPGPFLLALTGVNENAPAGWTAIFGPLRRATTGGAVTYAGPRASVPFVMADGRTIEIARTNAQFDLAFSNGTTLPVTAVELSGTLANACSSLSLSSVKLIIPDSAGSVSFHGSTVGDLMNPAGASTPGPWPLELSGLSQQVYAVGVVDAGTEP
jgi:hypothetical protein